MPGKGQLTITGQLGDVMRESAQAALSYVRVPPAELAPGAARDWFAEHDVHMHVPAGAIPKDGPSAGITMATALVSLITGRRVPDDVAMTGEVTLTGQVLPIGGLKEKALAAQRSGIRTVIAPALNEPDVDEIPEHLRADLTFEFVDEVPQVLEAALDVRAPGIGSCESDSGICSRRIRKQARGEGTDGSQQEGDEGADAAEGAWTNPYVQRIVQDESLRDDVRVAYENLRSAYGRAANGKAPAEGAARGQEAAEGPQDGRRRAAQRRIALREGTEAQEAPPGPPAAPGLVGAGLASP